MASEDPNTWLSAKDALLAAGGFIITLGGIIGRSQVKRIDDAHDKISRFEKEHDDTIAAIRQELREGFQTMHKRQDELLMYLLRSRDGPMPQFRESDRGNDGG